MHNSQSAVPASPAPAAGAVSVKHEKLAIGGIRCAACVQLIEFRLQQLAGVTAFKVNSASHRAEIAWDCRTTSLPRIVAAISDLGYSALPAGSQGSLEEREKKMALWRLFVAGFAMMQVMMYAFPAYLYPVAAVDGDLTPDIDRLLKLASLAITLERVRPYLHVCGHVHDGYGIQGNCVNAAICSNDYDVVNKPIVADVDGTGLRSIGP